MLKNLQLPSFWVITLNICPFRKCQSSFFFFRNGKKRIALSYRAFEKNKLNGRGVFRNLIAQQIITDLTHLTVSIP